jgi:predicted DCC family thiol-disulfide oxidoreductase YuxK
MDEKALVLFDGVCNMCNGFVHFIIPRDRKDSFRFGSLQSGKVVELLLTYGHTSTELSTVVLIEHGQIFTSSTAVLRIARRMGGPWALFYVFVVLPKFFRDSIYNLVGRNRYRWFGKKDACLIPRPEWKVKFID